MAFFTAVRSVWIGLGTLFGSAFQGRETHQDAEDTVRTESAERDVVNDLLWSNPEAFAGGFDADYMTCMYGPRY